MNRVGRQRKRLFDAALAWREETRGHWADRHGVSKTHLYNVVTDIRPSRSLLDRVDRYTSEFVRDFCTEFAGR